MKLVRGILKLIDFLIKTWGYISVLGFLVIWLGIKVGMTCEHEMFQCDNKSSSKFCGICKKIKTELEKSMDEIKK